MNPRFFIDNNLPPQLARGMSGFGEDVIHLKDRFEPDTPDAEWLKCIGEEGIFLITKDRRIRSRPAELALLKKYEIGGFYIDSKETRFWEIIHLIVKNWPEIRRLAERTRKPFLYRIPVKGSTFKKFNL